MLYLSTKVTLLFAFRYFFIIYFYICSVNTDCVKDMQTLLNDIELDIQELKCLMQAISSDANPTLRIVARRNIQQMKARLEALQELLEEAPTVVVPPLEELPAVTTPLAESASPVEPVVPDTMKMVCEEPATVHTAEALQTVATSVFSYFGGTHQAFQGLAACYQPERFVPFCPRTVRRRYCTDE